MASGVKIGPKMHLIYLFFNRVNSFIISCRSNYCKFLYNQCDLFLIVGIPWPMFIKRFTAFIRVNCGLLSYQL